jgi:hypothetical protein
MDDLDAGVLDDAPHDVDGRIVAVEKGSRRYQPNGIPGFIDLNLHAHETS